MNKFENLFKQDLIEHNQQLITADNILKQSLASNKTINCALVQHMDLLCEMPITAPFPPSMLYYLHSF
ncbi:MULTISPECIES: hypothetical protein [Sphingobacterium]|nr:MULTISPECIES: hypothetical protein [unclassified Sphingobacterium]